MDRGCRPDRTLHAECIVSVTVPAVDYDRVSASAATRTALALGVALVLCAGAGIVWAVLVTVYEISHRAFVPARTVLREDDRHD